MRCTKQLILALVATFTINFAFISYYLFYTNDAFGLKEPSTNSILPEGTEFHEYESLRQCVLKGYVGHYGYAKLQYVNDPLVEEFRVELIAKLLCLSGELPDGFASKWAKEAAIFSLKEDSILQENDVRIENRCSEMHSLLFSNDPSHVGTGSGFGSRMHMLALGIHLAYISNKPPRALIIQSGGWLYSNKHVCRHQDYRCYFKNITPCFITHPNFPLWLMPRFALKGWGRTSKTVQMPENNYLTTPSVNNLLPEKYRHKGWLWYYSQIFFYMLQPIESVRKQLENTIREIHFAKPAIGKTSFMFIRSEFDQLCMFDMGISDKSVESDAFELDQYLKFAEKLRLIHNVTNVFIFTDDPAVIQQARNKATQFNFFFTKYERKNIAVHKMLEEGDIDGYKEAMNLLRVLYIAAECDYFIGTFSSGWSRTVFKYMVGKLGRIPPHFSLNEWSYDQTGQPGKESRAFVYA